MQFFLESSTREVSYPDEDYTDWSWCATVPKAWLLDTPLFAEEEDCNG